MHSIPSLIATPALVSEDSFNQVQLRLKRNKELATRNAKREYLLAGYVFCDVCGRRYVAHKKTQHSYYGCPACKGKNLNAQHLETAVWNKLKKALLNPKRILASIELIRNEANKEEPYRKELDTLEAKLTHAAREKDRVWKAFELTGDEAKFRSEIKAITDRIDELQRQREELANRIELARHAEATIKSVEEYCELVRHNLGDFSFAQKRELLETLHIRVRVSNETIHLHGALVPIVSSQCA